LPSSHEGRLAGTVAVITGAASGIGAACAARFASEGARIAGIDIAKPPDGGSWETVTTTAPDAGFWLADVRDESAIETIVGEIAERFSRIDSLVNAAGVSTAGAVADVDLAEWNRVIGINLTGTFVVSKHVVRRMQERESGSIVNLASIEGLEAMEAQAAYNASKGGVVLLTKNMAIDYGHQGIRVNCLCPGLIETPMTEVLRAPELAAVWQRFVDGHMLRRAGRPEEVASAALFLVSEDASFVSGHALTVDGGYTAGKRLLDPAG
jgi:meso-butanediol dehydrogenase/(S,S)-butanediol dehydrogenase/diacetyl reductase